MGSARLPPRLTNFEDDTDRVSCFFRGMALRLGSGTLEQVSTSESPKTESSGRRRSLESRSCRICREKTHLTRDCPQKKRPGSRVASEKSPVGAASDRLGSFGQRLRRASMDSLPPHAAKGPRELAVEVADKTALSSPRTPEGRSQSPVQISQQSSPVMASFLSQSSNKDSPISTSSSGQFPDVGSSFSSSSFEPAEPCQKSGVFMPSVEFPLDDPEQTDGHLALPQPEAVRKINRWRSLSLSEFARLGSLEEGKSFDDPGGSLPSCEIEPVESSEVSDFDKFGIDIDLYVGSSRLPRSTTGSEVDLAALCASPATSWSSTSYFSRQTTANIIEETDPAKHDKWHDNNGSTPLTWSMSSRSYGREDSFPQSERSVGEIEPETCRQTDDKVASVDLGNARDEGADCTEDKGQTEQEPSAPAAVTRAPDNGPSLTRSQSIATSARSTAAVANGATASRRDSRRHTRHASLVSEDYVNGMSAPDRLPSKREPRTKGDEKVPGKDTLVRLLRKWLAGSSGSAARKAAAKEERR